MGPYGSILTLIFISWIIKKLGAFLGSAKTRLPFPPGPKAKPFLGNILDFPFVDIPQVYAEWGRKFNSPILHIEALGNHVIIVNSFEDAEQIFEQSERAKIYADRPRIPLVPLIGWDYNVALIPYGDRWRQHRRVCQQYFNAQAARNYEPMQTIKVRQLLQGLLETPKNFELHSKMFSIGLTAAMMYGYDLKSIEDPIVTTAEEATALCAKLLAPGGSLINVIPALQHFPSWFPGSSSLKLIAQVKQLTEEALRIPMDFVKEGFEDGTVTSSLVSDFYEKKFTVGATSEEEQVVNNVALTVYGAASDTTISSTATFFYTMTVSPEVQKEAQAEIDRVVGSKRLPTLADRGAMPYVEAVYREVLRFSPPLPLGVPHSPLQDDIYKGYFIPRGATVLINLWAMNHNEEVFPDPFKFKPERFIDENGKLTGPDRISAYGFGRRICVGKHIADATMWLMIASVLACFDITQAKDEHGNPVEVNDAYDLTGLVSVKEKFECNFRARPGARNLILETL